VEMPAILVALLASMLTRLRISKAGIARCVLADQCEWKRD
jgi:hypothetical protein